MLFARKNQRNGEPGDGKPFRLWASSRDLASSHAAQHPGNGFLDIRCECLPNGRGRRRSKLRVSLILDGKNRVLDSFGVLSLTKSLSDCTETEDATRWHLEIKSWYQRAVIDLICPRAAHHSVGSQDGIRRLRGEGRGEVRLYRGKHLTDTVALASLRLDWETSDDARTACQKEMEPSPESPVLPASLEKALSEVDWSRREVLVGSLGSREQFRDNLKRNYYYVPAKYLDQDQLPIGYVALYQSANLFGRDAGVRYYGEVTETRHLLRREIKFRSRWRRDDETYYAFRIKEWRQLPRVIEVKDEGVYAPRLTNLFLLHHATQSYELFHVGSAEQYRLLYLLGRICATAAKNPANEQTLLCRLDARVTLSLQNGILDVLNQDGKTILNAPIRASDFLQHPKYYFGIIVERAAY